MRRRWIAALAAGALLCAGARPAAEWAISWAPQGSVLAHDELPFYARADLVPRWDRWSRRRTVGALALVDARGRAIDERAFAGGPTVVSFFWTGCGSVCPTNIDLLRALGTRAKVMLISDQPLIDDPAALRRYAADRSLPARWRLATGEPGRVFGFARAGLFIDVERRAADGGPPHAEINFLIDRRARLRGIYDANSPLDATRLQDDLGRLAAERNAA